MKRALPLDVDRVAEALALRITPLLKRIEALEAREAQHLARIAELEARAPLKGEKGDSIKGDPGSPGRGIADAMQDADGNLLLIFSDGMTKNIGRVRGDDGEGSEGKPGANATDDQVMVAVAKYLDMHPPQPGKPGDPGKSADPITPAQISEAVFDYLTANPPTPGKPGDSIKGDEGRGLKSALIDAEGNLVLTFTDGDVKVVGRVKGEPGEPGKTPVVKDGIDGTGWDDLIVEYDGERTFKFVTIKGDQRREHGSFVVPVMIYRGVFDHELNYERGDTVTWAGNLWYAHVRNSEKPDLSNKWQLAVKRGRDGKNAEFIAPKPLEPIKLK